jgi:hypothetical protein
MQNLASCIEQLAGDQCRESTDAMLTELELACKHVEAYIRECRKVPEARA